MRHILVIACFSGLLLSCTGNPTPGDSAAMSDSPGAITDKMEWWRDARFGMFIHWGLYAIPAGEYQGERTTQKNAEWIMNNMQIPIAEYEKYATRFNPEKFDADQWVAIAKNAGMKYIVITSKHHDGFCLWDSRVSDYDVMDASPFKRCGECRKASQANDQGREAEDVGGDAEGSKRGWRKRL